LAYVAQALLPVPAFIMIPISHRQGPILVPNRGPQPKTLVLGEQSE